MGGEGGSLGYGPITSLTEWTSVRDCLCKEGNDVATRSLIPQPDLPWSLLLAPWFPSSRDKLERIRRSRIKRSTQNAQRLQLVVAGFPTFCGHAARLSTCRICAGYEAAVAQSLGGVGLLRRIKRGIQFEKIGVCWFGVA